MARRILIWLPSPMGDAIMATPALRALRSLYSGETLIAFGSRLVREVLSPCPYCDEWLDSSSFARNVSALKAARIDEALLLKNSFGSALTVRLAGIPRRVGYARDGRSFLLTDRIEPVKDTGGRFVPVPTIDYYLRIAQTLGADITDKTMTLSLTEADANTLASRLPAGPAHRGPRVILVPGGGFGPSKCWPADRFARLADALIEKYGAAVVISVAPNPAERKIAAEIQSRAKHPLISLGDTPLPMGPLKALFARADLVVTNDTGPRHIAAAFGRPLISLFGPNNPVWAQTGSARETQVVGRGPCVPCTRPQCSQSRHICMESITVEEILAAAEQYLSEREQ